MSSSKAIQVVKNSAGSWAVRNPASAGGRAVQVFSTRAEAVKAAQAALRTGGGELQIHGADGRVKSSFTLGRTAMTKLNAVEGVTLSATVRTAFEDFDRKGLTPSQRRAHLRKTAGKGSGRDPTPPKG